MEQSCSSFITSICPTPACVQSLQCVCKIDISLAVLNQIGLTNRNSDRSESRFSACFLISCCHPFSGFSSKLWQAWSLLIPPNFMLPLSFFLLQWPQIRWPSSGEPNPFWFLPISCCHSSKSLILPPPLYIYKIAPCTKVCIYPRCWGTVLPHF